MPIKTFVSGEILTASDTNAYLNNGGLVYITAQTVGSAVSSVTVSNCFSATYDNYRIIYNGGTGTTDLFLRIQLSGITGANYFGGQIGARFDTGAFAGQSNNGLTQWNFCGSANSVQTNVICDLIDPFATRRTLVSAAAVYSATGSSYGVFVGETTSTASASGFVLSTSTGTITGGTIRVYGYRQA